MATSSTIIASTSYKAISTILGMGLTTTPTPLLRCLRSSSSSNSLYTIRHSSSSSSSFIRLYSNSPSSSTSSSSSSSSSPSTTKRPYVSLAEHNHSTSTSNKIIDDTPIVLPIIDKGKGKGREVDVDITTGLGLGLKGKINPTPPPPSPKREVKIKAKKNAITLKPAALHHLSSLSSPTSQNPQLIRISVKNRGCAGLAYHLEYVPLDKVQRFDEVVEQDGVKVLIDSKALFSIIGSEMDWVEDRLSAKFVFNNPNIKDACGCGESFTV